MWHPLFATRPAADGKDTISWLDFDVATLSPFLLLLLLLLPLLQLLLLAVYTLNTVPVHTQFLPTSVSVQPAQTLTPLGLGCVIRLFFGVINKNKMRGRASGKEKSAEKDTSVLLLAPQLSAPVGHQGSRRQGDRVVEGLMGGGAAASRQVSCVEFEMISFLAASASLFSLYCK